MSELELTTKSTVLDALLASLDQATTYNSNVLVAPAVILWPDKERQWAAIMPRLRELRPELITFGDYEPDKRQGPAPWVKCMVARKFEAADWAAETTPILYLPGISRADLRAVESCPPELQPLADLQYRGSIWSQVNARDWSVFSFLVTGNGGLGLDVSRDSQTQAAMTRALPQILDTPVSQLRGNRLEAKDFDQLLTTDPVRDLLRWLNDPPGTRAQWGSATWQAFRSICKGDFSFDPQDEGELIGAERLGGREGAWSKVWSRFSESPGHYPKLPALLDKAQPELGLFPKNKSSWPSLNANEEKSLRESLGRLDNAVPHKACASIVELDARHAERRRWVWNELGQSPLADAVGHLAALAQIASETLGGDSPEAMAELYGKGAWRADAASWQALAAVTTVEDVAAVTAALRSTYRPWIERSAERLQKLVKESGFPGELPAARKTIKMKAGDCMLFADGLRLDVGHELVTALHAKGLEVQESTRWIGLPSVTATCKPSVSPVADLISGRAEDEDFVPSTADEQKPLTTHRFRKLLEEREVQVLGGESTGNPRGKGWCEHGDLDHAGHDEGAKLARRVGEQVREMCERINGLLGAGWKQVRVVTDHGWLLMPGGLPKVELPKYLAETRWGRCAVLKQTSTNGGLVVPWRWSGDVQIALAPGIGCFVAGTEYAHGGLSLQECVVPELLVTRVGGATVNAKISEIGWRGLRCRVAVEDSESGMTVDLRTKPAAPDSSLCDGGKALKSDGSCSLLVENDDNEGMAAVLVLLSPGGAVVARQNTTVGGDD